MLTLATQAILAKQLEVSIDRQAKISRIANRKYESMFKGKATTEVVIRRFPDIELNHGVSTSAGAPIAESGAVVQSENYSLSELNTLNVPVADADKIINDFNQESEMQSKIALRQALNHDSFVASLAAKYAGTCLYDQSPATVTKDTAESVTSAMQQKLFESDVEEKNQCVFINPAFLGLANQSPMRTGFDDSLKFKEVFNAGQLSGLRSVRTNNLPIKYTLTIGAAVTANDTITIRVPNAQKLSEGISPAYDEVVWTAKAVPTNAGEFYVHTTAGGQATIIEQMTNGTGTPGATNYIECSAANRNILRRGFIHCDTFGAVTANKAGITARAGVTIVVSLTSGSNVIAARTNLLIALDPKAIHFGELMQNFKIVGTESNNTSFGDNVMFENVYGGKVTTTNAARICLAEITN